MTSSEMGLLFDKVAPLFEKASVPIYFWKRSLSKLTVTPCATALRLGTGKKQLYITCQHVWQQFLEYKSNNSDAFLGAVIEGDICEIKVTACIDNCANVDIAVLDIAEPPTSIHGLPVTTEQFYSGKSQPLLTPTEGEMVVVAGYPAHLRKLEHNILSNDLLFLFLNVTKVAPTRIYCADGPGERLKSDGTQSAAPLNGMSGSPVYIVRENQPCLVGIFTDGDTTQSTLIVSLLKHVNFDGTLDWLGMPPVFNSGYMMPLEESE